MNPQVQSAAGKRNSNIFTDLIGMLALPLESLARTEFGERYMSIPRLFAAGVLLVLVFAILTTLPMFSGELMAGQSVLFVLIFLTFMGLSIYHRYAIMRRNHRGVPWYSYCFGLSHLQRLSFFRRFHDWHLYLLVEPSLFAALGFLLFFVVMPLGTWLIASSIALFLKNYAVYTIERNEWLDMLDAQIRASYLSASINGAPKEETAGWTVIPAADNENLREMVKKSNMADTVNDVMGKDRETNQTTPQSSMRLNTETPIDTLRPPVKRTVNSRKPE